MDKSITALTCVFVRSYHYMNSNIKIYSDKYARKIMTDDEYNNMSLSMEKGISFFNPSYNGDNPLLWVVNNVLGPTILARDSFNKQHLFNEIGLGLKQYIILGSGYDTSGYMVNSKVKVFEIDRKKVIDDKIERINRSQIDNENVSYIGCDLKDDFILKMDGFNRHAKTYCSLLGLSYYLDKFSFLKIIKSLSDNMPVGSVIIFDYPNELDKSITRDLAKAAEEEMKCTYTYEEILDIANMCSLNIYEHLNNKDIDNTYFYDYNSLNPNNIIKAPEGVNYCLLVKR